MPMRHPDHSGPTITQTGALPAFTPNEADPRGRASHVLLLNGRREILLRRVEQHGLPGDMATSSVVVEVRQGESFEIAANRGLRETLGLRHEALRFVDRIFHDHDGQRTFLAVYVALHDGPLSEGDHRFVPIDAVARAIRRGEPTLHPSFVRAFKAMQGEA